MPISPKPPRGRNLIGESSTKPPAGRSRGHALDDVGGSGRLVGAHREVAFSIKSGKGLPSVYVRLVPRCDLPSDWGRSLKRPRPRPRPRPPRRPPPAVRERREEGNTRGQVERSGRGASACAHARFPRKGTRRVSKTNNADGAVGSFGGVVRGHAPLPPRPPPRPRPRSPSATISIARSRRTAEMGVAATRRGDANAPARAANARGATTWRGGAMSSRTPSRFARARVRKRERGRPQPCACGDHWIPRARLCTPSDVKRCGGERPTVGRRKRAPAREKNLNSGVPGKKKTFGCRFQIRCGRSKRLVGKGVTRTHVLSRFRGYSPLASAPASPSPQSASVRDGDDRGDAAARARAPLAMTRWRESAVSRAPGAVRAPSARFPITASTRVLSRAPRALPRRAPLPPRPRRHRRARGDRDGRGDLREP